MWVLLLTALVMGGTSLFISFYLQSVHGLTPLNSALWLLPQMIAMIITANLGPWLGRTLPPARIVAACMVLMMIGFTLFALTPEGPAGLYVLAAGSVLTTGGIGASFPFLMNDIISHAPQDRAGSAASFAQTANEIGIALGLVVMGSIGTVIYRSQLTSEVGHADGSWVDGLNQATTQHDGALLGHVQHAFTDGFHAAALTAVGVMAVVTALTVRALNRRANV
jgi:MFS transporter, DHA2 family, multidrug resistance protein